MEPGKLLILHRKVNSAPLLVGALLIGALVGASSAETPMYRWIDESGGVVFSQTPPPPGIEAKLMSKPPPPAESPEVAKQRLEQQLQVFDEAQKKRQQAKEKAEQTAALAERRAQGCAAAQYNLDLYTNSPPNRLIDDGSGTYRRFTEEERAAKIQQARDYLEKNCQ